MSKMRRREWLKIGALAGLTPIARSIGLQAQTEMGGAIPKRFITLNMGHGWALEEFTRAADGTLGEVLSPLQAFSDELLILNRLRLPPHAADENRDGHQLGFIKMLSGDVIPKEFGTRHGGMTVDRAIGHGIRGESPFASYCFGADFNKAISADGVDQDLFGVTNPAQAFRELFGGFMPESTDPGPADLERLRRRSIVDFARGEYEIAEGRLSGASRRRIELHREALFEIGNRIRPFVPPRSCALPAMWDDSMGGAGTLRADERYPYMVDLAVAALSCGVTNVASISLTGNPFPGQYIPGIENPTLPHHVLSHPGEAAAQREGDDDVEAVASWVRDSIRSQRWYIEQVASIMNQLSAIEEVDGSTMLDHTTILVTTEMNAIDSHDNDAVTYLLAGNVDGYFNTGREFDCGQAPHANLFSTLMDAYGLESGPFGSTGTGMLEGLGA